MAEGTILDRIVARKRQEVAEARSRISEVQLLDQAAEQSKPRRFLAALADRMAEGMAPVIAEVKRASPSKGVIHPSARPFDPATIAKGYEEHGAACISCLTDRDFFQGDNEFIAQIRQQIALPVLRKDFLLDPYQVAEARAIGADAVLLILAILSDEQARELEDAAGQLHMDVLVEVHDEWELERAHHLSTPLLGINNRDLKSFKTSLQTSVNLASRAHHSRFLVSESGINTAADVRYLQQHGLHAFLVGEMFMREEHPGQALGRMLAELA